MKVFHFLPWYTTAYSGGTEQFLFNLANLQTDAGDEVELIQPNNKLTDEITLYNGIKVYRFACPQPPLEPEYYRGESNHYLFEHFHNYLINSKPDVIHFHGTDARFIYQHKIISSLNIATLVTTHLLGFSCMDSTLLKIDGSFCNGRISLNTCSSCIVQKKFKKIPLVTRIGSLLLTKVFERSPEAIKSTGYFSLPTAINSKKNFIDFLARESRLGFDALNNWYADVLHINGVPQQKIFQMSSAQLKQSNYSEVTMKPISKLRMLFVGRISVSKGVHMALKAISNLPDFKDTITLVLAGDVTDSHLTAQIADLKKRGFHIELLGRIPNDEVLKLMPEFDYLLFPSIVNEMLPLSIQEAINSNLPVIASDSPSTRSLILPGKNGYLFKMNDADELCAVIRQILLQGQKLSFLFSNQQDKYSYYHTTYTQIMNEYEPEVRAT